MQQKVKLNYPASGPFWIIHLLISTLFTVNIVGAQVVQSDILIEPETNLNVTGEVGGPFAPLVKQYQITNQSLDQSLSWGVQYSVDWITIEPEWGMLAADDTITIEVTINSNAETLAEGIYRQEIIFTDITNQVDLVRQVNLTVGDVQPGILTIEPEDDFLTMGEPGGPFNPASFQYQLNNTGESSLYWAASVEVDWIDLDQTFGAIDPNELIILSLNLNQNTESLEEGLYEDILKIYDLSNNRQIERKISLWIRHIGGLIHEPSAFEIIARAGCTVNRTLTLGNDSKVAIDFNIYSQNIITSDDSQSDEPAGDIASSVSLSPAESAFKLSDGAEYIPGELIVRFAPPLGGMSLDVAAKDGVLRSLDCGTIKSNLDFIPGLTVVKLPDDVSITEALKRFSKSGAVLYAQPNYIIKALQTAPNDEYFDDLWGMHNTSQTGGTEDADIDGPEAWEISTGSRDVIVAVIDTGVDYEHEDLAANMWVNESELNGATGVDDDNNGFIDDIYGYDFRNDDGDPMDDNSHGTHCAGTIGAVGNNGIGVTGVCWNVRMMALKFLNAAGDGSTIDAVQCINYGIQMGVDVMSNSWGGSDYSQSLKDAIVAAEEAGIIFIAAAGNKGYDNDSIATPLYPASYDNANIISVLNTNNEDRKYSGSNYGVTTVDLGAPGTSIYSCRPGNHYQYKGGTSMATPHVAGACALLWSVEPSLGVLDVKNILMDAVDEIEELSVYCVAGGRLNLYNALNSLSVNWLDIAPLQDEITPGNEVGVSLTIDATGLTPGLYSARIILESSDPLRAETIIPISLIIEDNSLAIEPVDELSVSLPQGGPVDSQCLSYVLTNNGSETIGFSLENNEDWLVINPTGVELPADGEIEISACLTESAGALEAGDYSAEISFSSSDDCESQLRTINLSVTPPDYFTEKFTNNDNDLDYLALTFTPDDSIARYEACRNWADDFQIDPNNGAPAGLGDDDFLEVVFNNNQQFTFYDRSYDRVYIGANGYITFGGGDDEYEFSLENHFSKPRISALFTDLTPMNGQSVTYQQLDDRLAASYINIPEYGDKNTANNFQIELFFIDGKIRITWLDVATGGGLAGLSSGVGMPAVFLESNLNGYEICYRDGDFNRDRTVDVIDLSILAGAWLADDCQTPTWCDRTDLNRSSCVDINDFSIFSRDWLYFQQSVNAN